MAYLGPKNKLKIKESKPDEFMYLISGDPFNGSYIQTSKGEYFEGDDPDNPGEKIVPSNNNIRKFNLLALLKTLLAIAASIALILQVLEELKSIMTDLAELAEIESMIEELLSIPDGESLSEQNLSNLNNSLSQFPTENFPVSNNIVVHDGVYNDIKANIYNKLNTNQSPINFKILPSEQDYINGSYVRYVAKRRNSLSYYIEINKNTYDSIRDKKKKFDSNLYQVFALTWNITSNAREYNTATLNNAEQTFPNIKLLFNDPIEYAPVGRANLYAEEGELYYIDGTPYIGPYHVHPTKGPMVGATHTAEPHDNLYYSYELGSSLEELQTDIFPEESITGKVFTHIKEGMRYEFYIRENRLGIFIEVIDVSDDDNINTIYVSTFFNKNSTTTQQLIDLAVQELDFNVHHQVSYISDEPSNERPEDDPADTNDTSLPNPLQLLFGGSDNDESPRPSVLDALTNFSNLANIITGSNDDSSTSGGSFISDMFSGY